MNVRLLLRRLALAGSALTFGFIALASIVAPTAVAARYAYTVGTADACSRSPGDGALLQHGGARPSVDVVRLRGGR